MKKIILFLFANIFVYAAIYAQSGYIVEPSTTGGAYIIYTIQKGDNLSNIARQSGINLQALLSANPKYSKTTPIYPNQQILIPLSTAEILSKDQVIEKDYVPLYYQIKPKEGLYRISLKFNRVPIPTLVKWNSIDSEDLIIKGRYLVIGYLKDGDLSGATNTKIITSNITKSHEPENTVSTAAKARTKPKSRQAVSKRIDEYEVNDNSVATSKSNDLATNQKSHAQPTTQNNSKKEPQRVTEVDFTNDKTSTISTNLATQKGITGNVSDSITQPITPVPAAKKMEDSSVNELASNVVDNEGFFKPLFLIREKSGQQLQAGDLMCSTFENESGRTDKRYYALINGVPVGQIIKITAPSTNRSVYLKVLGPLNDDLKRKKIDVCISLPSAEQLEMKGESFIVKCTY